MATSLEAVQVVGNLSPRVALFVTKASVAVMNEDNTTTNHTERAAFSIKVFVSDYDLIQYTYAVLSNSTILSGLDITEADLNVNDSDIEFVVNSVFDAFAGVST